MKIHQILNEALKEAEDFTYLENYMHCIAKLAYMKTLYCVYVCLGSQHFDIFIQGVCADGPGQSKITDMISHNGYFGCRLCEFEGCYSAAAGTCVCTWEDFERSDPQFRTRERFELCLREVERLQMFNEKKN